MLENLKYDKSVIGKWFKIVNVKPENYELKPYADQAGYCENWINSPAEGEIVVLHIWHTEDQEFTTAFFWADEPELVLVEA